MDIKEAASSARHLAKSYQSVLMLVEALEEVGNIRAAKLHADKELVATEKLLSKERAALATLKKHHAEAATAYDGFYIAANEKVKTAKALANTYLDKAATEGNQLITDARGQAADIKNEAASAATEVRLKTKTLKQEATKLEQGISNLRKEMAQLKAKFA